MRGAATLAGVLLVMALVVSARAAQAPSTPTFNRQVAPILFANCVTCHRPDGIAPFSLLTFDEAQPHADDIRVMVSERAMPPWFADPKFGQFKNSRALTQAQID